MASPGHRGTKGVDGHSGREDDAEGDEPYGEHLLVMKQLSEDSGDDPVHRVLIEAKRRLSIPREIGPPSSPQVLVLPGLSARDRSSVDFSVARRALSQAHWPRSFRCFLEFLHTPIDAPERPFFVNIFNILGSHEIMPDLEGIPQGDDNIRGGAGIDWIYGNADDDTLWGGAGNDYVFGNDGVDELNGEAGIDQMSGGNGDDTLNGGTETDILWGDNGDDTLNGDGDNDFLHGGPGNDTLTGGVGTDTCWGDAHDSDPPADWCDCNVEYPCCEYP